MIQEGDLSLECLRAHVEHKHVTGGIGMNLALKNVFHVRHKMKVNKTIVKC